MKPLYPPTLRARLEYLDESPQLEMPVPKMFAVKAKQLKAAGVLIPLTERDGRMHVLLTRRTDKLRNHSGEISFPGGRHDEGDDGLLGTALRESWEEVGLGPEDVYIYGSFANIPTVTGYSISSFVGEFPQGYTLNHNPDEIDYLILAPLDELCDLHRVVVRDFNGVSYPIHYFDYGEQPIWGATAYILYEFLKFIGVMEGK